MTDLISAAAVVAAVALLVLARRTPQRSGALVAMAGVGLGLGIGSKYTALLPGLVVGFGAIFLLRRSRAWWWLAPGVLLLAAPWYLRNLLTTGNPLFPQAIGPLDGGQSPIDLLESSLFDQLVDGETGILRRVADLAQDFLGPVLLIAAVGVLGPFLRRGDASGRQIARWLGGLAAAGLLLYALTPYTGGGPTGLAFIIASCFRYALIGMLLAGIVGVAVAGRRAGTMLALAVLGWNLSKAVRDAGVERTQLHLTARALAGGLVAAVLTMLVVHVLTVWPELRRRVPAAVVSVVALIGAVGATTAAFHRLDRGRTPSPLESMLLAYGEDEPAVVLGVADLRAVLGPRLERRMVKVARGGEAGEVPFADEAQFRRRVLGEDTPRHLGRELDAALDEAGTVLLVTGPVSPVAFPDGWRPDDSWCFAGADVEGVVFVRRAAMLPGVECVTADQL